MPTFAELTALPVIRCCAVVLTGFLAYVLFRAGRAHKADEERNRYWLERQREMDRRDREREERGFE